LAGITPMPSLIKLDRCMCVLMKRCEYELHHPGYPSFIWPFLAILSIATGCVSHPSHVSS
jgi:hypothetical protein